MKIRKLNSSGQRRRQLHRHHHKMTHRRLAQFVQNLTEDKAVSA